MTSKGTQLSFYDLVHNIDDEEYLHFGVSMVVFAAITIVFSIGENGCIWHFERFGGDPQKRTILNQLIGQLALNNIVGQAGVATLSFRIVFGPLSKPVYSSTFVLANITSSIVLLLILNEIILVRWLSMFVWKRSPPINDDFFGTFIMLLNYTIAFVFVSIGLIGGTTYNNMTFLLTGDYFFRDPKLSFISFLKVSMLLTLVLHLAFGIPVLYKKRKLKDLAERKVTLSGNPGDNDRYNNVKSNENLANGMINVLLIACFFTCLFVVFQDWKEDLVVRTVLGFLVPVFVINVALPFKIILTKSTIKSHIRAHLCSMF